MAVGCVRGESPQPPFCGRGAFLSARPTIALLSRPPVIPARISHPCPSPSFLPPIPPSFPRKRESTPRPINSGHPAATPPPPPPSFPRKRESTPQTTNNGHSAAKPPPHRHSRESGHPHPGQPATNTPQQSCLAPTVIPAKAGIHPSANQQRTLRRNAATPPHRHSGAGRNPEPRWWSATRTPIMAGCGFPLSRE